MDLNSILGWSVTLVAIAGLIIFIRIRKKSRIEKALAPLKAFARENNSEISNSEVWGKNLIGIDNNAPGSLFFIRSLPSREIREKINLSEISGCRINRTVRKADYNKEAVSVIDRVELVISFYNHKPEVSLEFFNTDYDQLTLLNELQLAQKWSDMIQGFINVNRQPAARKQTKGTIHNQELDPVSILPSSGSKVGSTTPG